MPFDLNIVQGADFELSLQLKNPDGTPFDITSFTFLASLRVAPQETPGVVPFTVVKAVPNTLGKILVSLSSAQTVLLTCRDYVWAILLVDLNGKRTEILRGRVFVEPQIV